MHSPIPAATVHPTQTKIRALCAGVVEAAALVALAVVPTFVSFYTFRIFELPKNAVFLSLAVLMGLAGLVALVEGGAAGLGGLRAALRRPLVVAALALGAVTAVATTPAVSAAPGLSFFGSSERAQGLVSLLGVLVLFGAVAWIGREPARRERLVGALVLGSLPVAVLAVLQAAGVALVPAAVESAARVFGSLSNPIFLGAYLMLVAPLTAMWALQSLRRGRVGAGVGLGAVAGLQLLALTLSVSRGPMLGLAAGVFVLVLAAAAVGGQRRLGWAAAGAAALGVAFLVVFNLPASPLAALRAAPIIGRFGTIADTSGGSEAARYNIWQTVNRTLAAEPARLVLGHGPETLKYAILPHGQANLPGRNQADRLVDRAHNVLLDHLVTTGIAGALALLAVYGAWLVAAVVALGLAPGAADRRRLAGLLALGAAAGAATWLALPTFAGALTLFGLVAGLVAYLVLALARPSAPDRAPDPLALGLLAAGAAAIVEAAFGIQTVVTQVVFWAAAGLVVALERGDVAPAVARTAAAAGERAGAAPTPGTVTLSWSAGGAALGLVAGAVMGVWVHDFILYGTPWLPATAGGVALLVAITWLGGLLVAAAAGESAAAAGITGLVVFAAYVGLRYLVFRVAQDAAVFHAATVLWLLGLALVAGGLLRARAERAPVWRGPVGIAYPLVAVLAVALVVVLGVKPVQADIYFQSAQANFEAGTQAFLARQSADADRLLGNGETLYARAAALNPTEDTYPLRWGQFYTQLGAASPDVSAAAVAFDKAQKLVAQAEALDPGMPYHTFNRGHLQLVFAQMLPPGQREVPAAGAEAALAEAFVDLPYDPQVANELALARVLQGRAAEAIPVLEHSLKQDPGNRDTYRYLGEAYAAAGRLDEAQATLERALTMGAGSPELLAALGGLAKEQGDLGGAVNYYQQAVSAGQEAGGVDWRMVYNLGLLYADIGDRDQALATLSQAMQGAPTEDDRARVQEAIGVLLEGGTGSLGAPSGLPGGVPVPGAP